MTAYIVFGFHQGEQVRRTILAQSQAHAEIRAINAIDQVVEVVNAKAL